MAQGDLHHDRRASARALELKSGGNSSFMSGGLGPSLTVVAPQPQNFGFSPLSIGFASLCLSECNVM